MHSSVYQTGLATGVTYPLKEGEGTIRCRNVEDEGVKSDYYLVYSNERIYQYIYSKDNFSQAILFISAKIDVEHGDNYIWFDNEDAIPDECNLDPGKYSANDVKGKCDEIEFEINFGVNDFFFKIEENAKEAYNVYNKKNVSPDSIEFAQKYDVKSYSELTKIMNSYPQSSLAIIPSIFMVLSLSFLFL